MTPKPTPTPIPADAPVDSPPFPDAPVSWPLGRDVAEADIVEISELSYMSCSSGATAENTVIVDTDKFSVVVYGIVTVATSMVESPEHCAVTIVDEDRDSAHFWSP